MHEVDLSKYNLRTDLIIEEDILKLKNNSYEKSGIKVDDIILKDNNYLNKKSGKYVTITYDDITDTSNYDNVLEILEKELGKMLKYLKIKASDTCLIIGLGNPKIISDAL